MRLNSFCSTISATELLFSLHCNTPSVRVPRVHDKNNLEHDHIRHSDAWWAMRNAKDRQNAAVHAKATSKNVSKDDESQLTEGIHD